MLKNDDECNAHVEQPNAEQLTPRPILIHHLGKGCLMGGFVLPALYMAWVILVPDTSEDAEFSGLGFIVGLLLAMPLGTILGAIVSLPWFYLKDRKRG